MYANFRYSIYDIFGVDLPWMRVVQTYGFFLAMAFLVSGVVLMQELRRREKVGLLKGVYEKYTVGAPATMWELANNALIGFIIGFKLLYFILNSKEASADGAGFLFSLQGNIIGGILMAALFGWMKYNEKQKEKLPQPIEKQVLVMPHERVSDLVIVAAISGVIGAKLLFFMGDLEHFFQNPVEMILSPAGLTIYGGLIFGFFVVSWYSRRKNINYKQLLDSASPVVMIAYGIGRLGCHFSGDGDWGVVSGPKPGWLAWLPDFLWSCRYPNNVYNEPGNPNFELMQDCNGFTPILDGMKPEDGYCTILREGVYPTSVYEFFLCAIIGFLLLRYLRKFLDSRPASLFAVYLMFNGLERLMIESIRVNDRNYPLGLTQAQWIAIALFVIGTGLFVYLFSKKPEEMSAEL